MITRLWQSPISDYMQESEMRFSCMISLGYLATNPLADPQAVKKMMVSRHSSMLAKSEDRISGDSFSVEKGSRVIFWYSERSMGNSCLSDIDPRDVLLQVTAASYCTHY
jgi:hypothetical protein